MILLPIVTLGVEMIYVKDLTHFINIGNFLVRASKDDLQLGLIYQDERANTRRIGFLRIKESDTKLQAGFTFGRGWSVLTSVDVETYGLAPGNYRMLFCVASDGSYALLDVEQKFFLGNYTLNLSTFDVVGSAMMNMSRVYVKAQNREIGFYALDEAVFAGFYPFTRGQTGDEGFFIGVGWDDGLSAALATKFRVPLGGSSIVVDFILAMSQERASVGIRGEWIGEKFKLDTCFVDGKFIFRVSF